ncbi:MAG: RNA polymerase sigma factor [Planctomycetaceae bacterium]
MSDSLVSKSDAELLKRFSKTRNERVFEELMERYGRLVMTICLRTLQNRHDAEDAFQATFLVLAEKAAKIRKRESLPSWLSGVAHRLSMNFARKRHRRDLSLKVEPEAARDHFADLEQRFDTQAMDEELHLLPEKYRDVLVRFYFLNQTSRQIAEALGITQGSADGRIKRGRQELRIRLAKRGVALGSVVTLIALSAKQASAAMAPTLIESTLKAAVANGSIEGLASAAATKLAGAELMRTGSMISSAAIVAVAVALLGLGSFGLNAALAHTALPATFEISTLVANSEFAERATTAPMAQEEETGRADRNEIGAYIVAPILDPMKSLVGPGQDKPTVETYQLRRPLKAAELAALLKRFETGESIKVDLGANTVTVTANRKQHKAIGQLAKKAGTPGFREAMENTLRNPAPAPRNRVPRQSNPVADLYEIDVKDLAKIQLEVLKEFPLTQTKVQDQYLAVFGTREHRNKVAEIIKKSAPDAKRSRIPAADPESKVSPARKPATSIPKFATAKLSIDGNSVMVKDPEAAKGVEQTYTVRVPYEVTTLDADRKAVKKMRFRDETRTRVVYPNGKKVYKLDRLKIVTVSGTEKLTVEILRKELDGTKPIVLLKSGQKLSDSFRQVLRAKAIVITLPNSEPAAP